MIRRREFTFLLGASPALARAATLPRSLEENAMVDEEIELIRAVHGLPSVSAAVFQRGGLRWIHASGLADRERAIEANPDTIYSLASVTKPLTAIAVMMLAERGSINLDAPANNFDSMATKSSASGVLVNTRLVGHEIVVDSKGGFNGTVFHDGSLDVSLSSDSIGTADAVFIVGIGFYIICLACAFVFASWSS